MLSADNDSLKEEDLLPFLVGVKKEDLLSWEDFGTGDWEDVRDVCKNKWGLEASKIISIKTIWKKHPANQKAPQPQGK